MKRPGPQSIVLIVVSLLSLGALFFGGYRLGQATQSVTVRIHPAQVTSARIIERDQMIMYEVRDTEGRWSTLTPTEFAEAVWRGHQSQTLGQRLMLRVLNISTVATAGWVLLGLAGQLLFAGRMVIQWLASEKARASVIPPMFWWLGLIGGLMLLVYFVWRKDVVGVLGQFTGTFIYCRNLYFIYARKYRQPPILPKNPGPVSPA